MDDLVVIVKGLAFIPPRFAWVASSKDKSLVVRARVGNNDRACYALYKQQLL